MKKELLFKVKEELVFSTLLLSNSQDDDYIVDAKKIISFICDAFELSENDKEKYIDMILDKALCLCTYKDARVFYQNKEVVGDLTNDELVIFQIKASCLRFLHQEYGALINYDEVQHYNRDYFYGQVDNLANVGRVKVVELLAILKTLGIGCERDYDEAIDLFKELSYWLPLVCVPYLKQVYKMKNDKKNYKLYAELETILNKYNPHRKSILSKEDEKVFSKEAKELFKLISSFQIDVINGMAGKESGKTYNILGTVMDYSFAEAIIRDDIDFNTKIGFINNYGKREWQEYTNGIDDKNKRIGF